MGLGRQILYILGIVAGIMIGTPIGILLAHRVVIPLWEAAFQYLLH